MVCLRPPRLLSPLFFPLFFLPLPVFFIVSLFLFLLPLCLVFLLSVPLCFLSFSSHVPFLSPPLPYTLLLCPFLSFFLFSFLLTVSFSLQCFCPPSLSRSLFCFSLFRCAVLVRL
ncbi:hypothetical protein POPTR_011G075450v4 [Populus trichocarpa]|uniref:Uncharacterized protein n=1 Tax=Populus trichocarpa TaxID=3694 RepID=A0ACC0S8L0_POPTR|nr:hypothetical protein BDE02_11G065900 [Populus trichocarpa]KAI9385537.1 hypothetical protein POPTR_011G075450v4 [Populus trichocarpa]